MEKLPVHWTTKISMKCKCNAITGELHRAKKTASNFASNFWDIEVKCIVNKYTAAGFSIRFICSIRDNFDNGKDNLIILQWLSEERKVFKICLPFFPSDESFAKIFFS